MFHRLLSPSLNKSFFLFGARGTGKSTYLLSQWGQKHHYINLLLDKWERRYTRDPDLLISDLKGIKPTPQWVVIDEIQKVPKLLDIVHLLIESTKIKFVLTGSSARKIKRGSANLLAGRAFHNDIFPLTHRELGPGFDLQFVLEWGSLPTVFHLKKQDRVEYLYSYTKTYLQEEILQEQIVRKGALFRSFLEVASQMNGKSLNFSKIARDVGVDTKTAQNFFQILEDTLVGRLLPGYSESTRKSVKLRPKFYLFDLGVKRAIEGSLESKVSPQTANYGASFEHFLIVEIIRLNSYLKKRFNMYHYQTSAGGEVDLILKRGKVVYAIEIKSTALIDEVEIRNTFRVASPLSPSKIYYVSNDPVSSKVGQVECRHWKDFLAEIFKG